MRKVCRTCGTEFNLTKEGTECKLCNRERQKQYRIKKGIIPHRDKPMVCTICGRDNNLSIANGKLKRLCRPCAAQRQKEQRKKPHSNHLKQHRDYRKRLRLEILNAYGCECVICGQTQEAYLQIDHINNDGAYHRRSVGMEGVYNDIKRQGFPKDKYQLLCANCHLAKTRGIDPYSLL